MKMRPSPPSAVAYLALAGLVAETRLELLNGSDTRFEDAVVTQSSALRS